MSFFVCINNMAGHHRALNCFIFKAERNYFFVAGLKFKLVKIYCALEDSRWSSCFKSACCKTKTVQACSKSVGCRFPYSSARGVVFTDKYAATKEGSCGKDNRTYRDNAATFCYNAGYLLAHSGAGSFACIIRGIYIASAVAAFFAWDCSLVCGRV